MSKLSASIPAALEGRGRAVALSLAALCMAGAAVAAQPVVTPAATSPSPAVAADAKQASKEVQKEAQKDAKDKERERLRKARDAERSEIQAKRSMIEQQRLEDEKLCYQKFAVEGCLAEARAAAREKDAPLRARELEINDAERKEKAADRLKAIEEKKAENAAVPMKAQQREKSPHGAPTPQGSGAKPAVDEEAARAQRLNEAQQRAAKQSDYVRRHEQNRAQADQGRAEREAKARADYEAKLREAEAHKASVLKKAQEGGTKAAPLPPPAP